ncbi:12902_t:CDS:10 [Cetraspora pellucida]|uniref:12902_t:CDS:1 n=1 Tax=Cetraspora pellucida TaxID=1433469 RepID=A0A9N9B0F1_9GLOM|nr:12902_t:CDS:10 [Cetraspora pellucida]
MPSQYVVVEARLIDGSDNNVQYSVAGTPHQPYLRAISSLNFNQNSSPVTSPTDFLGLNPIGPTTIKCSDRVPSGQYPMPRCITNMMSSYNVQLYNVDALSNYRSFRRTSHFVTFFGQYISFDITSSKNTNPTYPMFLPADDPLYNPNPNSTISPYQLSVPFLPANRSDGNNDTNPIRNPLLSGINNVTPFFDLNNIYGISDQDAMNRLRDTSTNRGKLKTSIVNGEQFPPKNNSDGSYIWGATSERSYSIFTLAIQTIWLREHNRLCDELYTLHGSSWTDEQYFQEARRWTIAFYQKAVAEEYIGAVLGRPLPAYQNYDPNLKPGVDTFFSTVTFRYGHSELSDFYRIQDEYGDTLYNLALNDIKNLTLLETFGLARVLLSMALQRQEEVDIFFADSTKSALAPDHHTYDLVAFDIIRSRDRGIPLYNVIRQYFGFPKAQSFADISSNPTIQANLAKIYPNGIETVESWVGVMSEDHLNGSNFGMVMNASMVTQYAYIRDSDNFWFEKPDMFTADEQKIIRNTTLRDIIIRNINPNITFPQNIWAVQPQIKLNSSDDDNYPSKINIWTQYIISYRVDLTYIYFKVQLQTSDGNGWFGMGFGPDDDGMKGAEFIIGIVTNGNVTLGSYHADIGGYHPPLQDSKQDPVLVPTASMSNSKAVTVEFKRLLNPPGRKPIVHGDMKFIMAYNPNSNAFSYHQNNRILNQVNFYDSGISSATTLNLQRLVRFIHASYFQYQSLLFGTGRMGLVVYALAFVELALGVIALWGQTSIVSVNKELTLFASLMAKLWWRIEGLSHKFFCIKDETNEEKKTMMHTHINYKDYIKLPEFTWEEINERVQRGAYLVVCDGLVVDIHSWCDSHPGGSQILLRVIGTDITSDFYNTHKNDEIVEDIDSPEALLIPKDVPSGTHSSAFTKYISHLQGTPAPQKRLSAAKFIDNINTKFYLRTPLAQHTHSRFATQKMATLVIGKLDDKISEKGGLAPSDGSIYQNPANDFVGIDRALASTPKINKFHRYKLTNKQMVNANVKYPVMRFTFSIVHQGEKDVSIEKFLPGHYVEVQSRVNGQIVIRSYTPLEGSLSKSFSIYVKIYPKGLFSQHLNEQLIGYEIQVRGPFDVSDRHSSNVAPTLANPLSRKTSILSPTRSYTPYAHYTKFTGAKTSLLNPDSPDGCWDELYMIAGGTGITPMLQLIKYYLEQSIKQKNDTGQYVGYKRMHLLFGNREIEDVIDGALLEDLALTSRGQLTVTHCLSEPPSDWDGLRGRITKKIIQDWINLMKGVLLQSPNNAQLIAENNNYMSILQSHSVRRDANEQGVSPLPIISLQSPPPTQPQSHGDHQRYDDDSIIDMGPRPESQASTGKFRTPKNIDVDLANYGRSDDLIQGKIIVCGPPDMLFTIEQALLEMGFTEKSMIILR